MNIFLDRQDKPLMLPIKEIIQENSRVKSFVFEYQMSGKPGQFVMTWVPGYDEKPFGVIMKDNVGFMISVAAVGEATKALHAMKIGDKLGFRGPYGTHFHLPEHAKRISLIGGGYGMVPLSYLAQEARKKKIEVDIFMGARTESELLFKDWMKEIGVNLHLSTDDGSAGYKGFNTNLFAEKLDEVKPDRVYVVGPEIMEVKITEICYKNNIPFEVSLERYIKCAIGLCGQCSVDPTGWRMCVEGPVLNGESLKQVTEFGKYHRTASGKIV